SIYYFRAERYDGSIVDEIQFMEMPSTKRIVSANYDEEGQLICYCQFDEGSFGWEQLVGSFVWEDFAEKLDLRTGRAEATSANEESAKKEQEPAQVYEEALAQLNDGDYEAAMTGFASLGDYKDSEQQYVRSVAGRAVQLLMQSDLESATQLLFDNRDFIHPENYPMLDTAEGISIYYFVSQNYDGSQHDEIQFMEMPSEKRIICAKFDTDGKRIGYARFDEASFSWNPYGKRFVWEEFVEKLDLKATAREGQPAGKPKAADQESRDLFNELFHEASWHPGWMGDDRIPSMGYNARGEQVTWVLDFIYQSSKGKRISDVSVSWGELEGEYAEAWEDAKAGKTYYFLSSYMDGRLTYSLLMPDDPSIAGWQTFAFTLDGYRVEYALELVYKGDYETGRGWGANDAYLVSITPV
ncbi:MAG: hypothetical protein J6A48_06655, partial [Clostridia bacterium]|nr:hypothetical protein [Clostridia bacterium]